MRKTNNTAYRWDKMGPNYYAKVGQHQLFIGKNDVTGRYHPQVDAMQFATCRTVQQAKDVVKKKVNAILLKALVDQRKEVDQCLKNAVNDLDSLETNINDIDDMEDYTLTPLQRIRYQSLVDDIKDMLEQMEDLNP